MSVSQLVLELWKFLIIRDWSEIQKLDISPSKFFPDLETVVGKLEILKFGKNVSNEKLLNAAKCKIYSYNRFWVIKGKATGSKNTPHSD